MILLLALVEPNDEEWASLVEELAVLGVDTIQGVTMTVRLQVKTDATDSGSCQGH